MSLSMWSLTWCRSKIVLRRERRRLSMTRQRTDMDVKIFCIFQNALMFDIAPAHARVRKLRLAGL